MFVKTSEQILCVYNDVHHSLQMQVLPVCYEWGMPPCIVYFRERALLPVRCNRGFDFSTLHACTQHRLHCKMSVMAMGLPCIIRFLCHLATVLAV